MSPHENNEYEQKVSQPLYEAGDSVVSPDSHSGLDVSRFLLGRQMIVVPLNFLIASIFTFAFPERRSPTMKVITALSLPTVICTLQFVQLAPQVFAGRHPALIFQHARVWSTRQSCSWPSRPLVSLRSHMYYVTPYQLTQHGRKFS